MRTNKIILSKMVCSKLKVAISENAYDEKLPPERELAKNFQVSRGTIREALKELQEAGIVTIRRGAEGGAFISELNSEPIVKNFSNLINLGKVDIPHLFHARICIEPQIAKAVAQIRSEKDIQRLNNLIQESKMNLASGALDHSRLINIDFHWQISKILKNPILSFISESITYNFKMLIINLTKGKINNNDISENIAEHVEILSAIEEKNGDQASQKTLQHLVMGYENLKKIMPNLISSEVDECINMYKI